MKPSIKIYAAVAVLVVICGVIFAMHTTPSSNGAVPLSTSDKAFLAAKVHRTPAKGF